MHTRYLLMFMLCFIRSGWSAPVDPTLLYGLTFQAHTSEKEARTSLHLTPEKPLFIRNAFTLEFDIRLRQEQECFGFIFRLINESEGYSIDLVSDLLSDQLFSLIADEKHSYRSTAPRFPTSTGTSGYISACTWTIRVTG